jgi:hypothetical protein
LAKVQNSPGNDRGDSPARFEIFVPDSKGLGVDGSRLVPSVSGHPLEPWTPGILGPLSAPYCKSPDHPLCSKFTLEDIREILDEGID